MNSPAAAPELRDDLEPDPMFVDSIREAGWILLMWLTCFIWTLCISLNFGYPEHVDPKTFPTILGIPAWVAVGIALPWLVADVVTIWFCMFRMKDGDLGDDGFEDGLPESERTSAQEQIND